MILVDASPLLSALGRANPRGPMALAALRKHGPDVLLPWPVLAELDYLLRSTVGQAHANQLLRRALAGDFVLVAPEPDEFELAVGLCERYESLGLQVADAVLMAIADFRDLPVLTWDFRDFRAVKRRDGRPFEFVVQEHEVPGLGGG